MFVAPAVEGSSNDDVRQFMNHEACVLLIKIKHVTNFEERSGCLAKDTK